MIDVGLLEFCVREDLNKTAPRVMAVLNPLKVVITNYPEGKVEEIEAENNPEDPSAGSRLVPFSREIYIEQEDFLETPPPKFFRLAPGSEVRLKNAYIIKCEEVVKDSEGKITELTAPMIPRPAAVPAASESERHPALGIHCPAHCRWKCAFTTAFSWIPIRQAIRTAILKSS